MKRYTLETQALSLLRKLFYLLEPCRDTFFQDFDHKAKFAALMADIRDLLAEVPSNRPKEAR